MCDHDFDGNYYSHECRANYCAYNRELSDEGWARTDPLYKKWTSPITWRLVRRETGNLKKLNSLREKIDWEMEDERLQFLDQLYPLLEYWQGRLPDLRGMFGQDGVEWLLAQSVKNIKIISKSRIDYRDLYLLIEFVIRAGYKDRPELDEAGRPVLRRTTPVHQAARLDCESSVIHGLFEIYDRFHVNYVDEGGLTHFHAACMAGCEYVVRDFLDLGQDPNCLRASDVSYPDPPLHLALVHNRNEVAKRLLYDGADPNFANKDGSTPLHLICKRSYDEDDLAKIFFDINKKVNQVVNVETRDNRGLTPLQLAVANFMPMTVNALLDNGANLSSFVFPTASYFGERFEKNPHCNLLIASGAYAVLECLEKRGYELKRSDALTIMKLITELGPSLADLEKCWYDDEDFAKKAKEMMMNPSLSLYDLLRSRPDEASKLLTLADYTKFVDSENWWFLPREYEGAWVKHLSERLWRGYFRRWTARSLATLTRHQLPIACREKIIEQLTNEDLFNICLAAAIDDNEPKHETRDTVR